MSFTVSIVLHLGQPSSEYPAKSITEARKTAKGLRQGLVAEYGGSVSIHEGDRLVQKFQWPTGSKRGYFSEPGGFSTCE